MPAILFGSISTVADTSELQREAFNAAFADARPGLDVGPRRLPRHARPAAAAADRIAEYAARARRGRRRGRRARDEVAAVPGEPGRRAGLAPAPGVVETIRAAKARRRWQVGLVTTTVAGERRPPCSTALSPDVCAARLRRRRRRRRDVDAAQAGPGGLRLRPEQPRRGAAGAASRSRTTSAASRPPIAAGLPCVAFPNENTAGHDFPAAAGSVDHARPRELAPPSLAGARTLVTRRRAPPTGVDRDASTDAFHVEAYEKIDYSLRATSTACSRRRTPSSPTATAASGAA